MFAKKILIFLVIALMFLGVLEVYGYSQRVIGSLASKVIRLHVVANSDSNEDQNVKLKVRDAIIKYMKENENISEDTDITEKKISNNLSTIEEIAKKTLLENNKNQNVKASIGDFYFPTKTYKDIDFPAGTYRALRIVLGSGQGKNWWCVLFPPLCISSNNSVSFDEDEKALLKSKLSKDEYELITREKKAPIKLKFKTIEMFQQSKSKVVALIDKIKAL